MLHHDGLLSSCVVSVVDVPAAPTFRTITPCWRKFSYRQNHFTAETVEEPVLPQAHSLYDPAGKLPLYPKLFCHLDPSKTKSTKLFRNSDFRFRDGTIAMV
jgi:hypothetical protein